MYFLTSRHNYPLQERSCGWWVQNSLLLWQYKLFWQRSHAWLLQWSRGRVPRGIYALISCGYVSSASWLMDDCGVPSRRWRDASHWPWQHLPCPHIQHQDKGLAFVLVRDKLRDNIGVMDAWCCGMVGLYEFWFLVNLRMTFVSIMFLIPFLSPTCVNVLVVFLV